MEMLHPIVSSSHIPPILHYTFRGEEIGSGDESLEGREVFSGDGADVVVGGGGRGRGHGGTLAMMTQTPVACLGESRPWSGESTCLREAGGRRRRDGSVIVCYMMFDDLERK